MKSSSDEQTESFCYPTSMPDFDAESPCSRTESLPDSLKSDAQTEACYEEVSKPERIPSPEEQSEEQSEESEKSAESESEEEEYDDDDEEEEIVKEEVENVEEEFFLVDNFSDLEKSISELQVRKTNSLKNITTLWDIATDLPITTHDDLNRIMVKLGFVSLPVVTGQPSLSPEPAPEEDPYNVAWKEYGFVDNKRRRITPRLPHLRIDGLHVKTYKLFIHAVGIHIGHEKARSLFRIKEVPAEEKLKEEDFDFDDVLEKSYRKGSVDGFTEFMCKVYKIDSSASSEEGKIGDEV